MTTDPVRPAALLRIGELARRHNVSPDLLRVWERRYGLLSPERSSGGFRLYSAEDDERVGAMRRHLAQGYSAAVAARMVLDTPSAPPVADRDAALAEARAELGAALEAFLDVEAQGVIDRLLATFSVEVVLRDVVLPYVRSLGDRWEDGTLSVAQEHFASAVLRGRLLGLARGFDVGSGPRALLACPSDEHHDLGLLCFGIGLREHGWRITYLGADTPIDTLRDTAMRLDPDLVVICAEREAPLRAVVREIAELSGTHRVDLAGRGASVELAHAAGADLLQDAPMAAAARIAREAERA
ncbi:MAG: cobalamin B12-binding domain-containing protein [Thermoleophilia bacterium]|nr:cobalamin B12-binding domain-containing protein [Thermoleophilia bacterium]